MKVNLSQKERLSIIYLLEREIRILIKTAYTPSMGNVEIKKESLNKINENNIMIKKLENYV